MKISYNWLRNYIETKAEIDEIADILTGIGLEVDGIERAEAIRGGLEGVVVGEVLECSAHPDSDHLHVTTVDVGVESPLQIVCGAQNVAAGQKVFVATIGTTLYPAGADEGFRIKKSKIRGAESFGMICAEDELGIGASHDGIMVLPAEAAAGTPASEYLGLQADYIIEIGLTPNRADAASHYGVARDLAAYFRANGENIEAKLPTVEGFAADNAKNEISVAVECGEGAPRYSGLTITGVKVAPSPEWLQARLRSIGINPKNNVVDITNFVLHELGQPLHAFDADRIEGGKVVVRTCPEGTRFTTLDGVERTLSERDLMICDAVKPMCIAGVLGGAGSGVDGSTTSVFLESAYFNPVWVRKSARRHGINTDASFRFERGVDPDITVYALKRAAMLIRELAGGEITSGITDIISDPSVTGPFRFELSLRRTAALIGKEIPEQTIKTILHALDVKVEGEKEGVLSVAVPAYRVDVRREADLIEDILRIYGYNNIEVSEKVCSSISYGKRASREKLAESVSNFLTANGFSEIMNNSLTKSSYYEGLESFRPENLVKIINPLSNDLNVMRQTLLFGMLEVIAMNTNHRNPNLRLYEFGNVYRYIPEKAVEGGLAPYSENYRLSAAITGLTSLQSWNEKAAPGDFFHLKAVAEKLLRRFGIGLDDLQSETLSDDIYSESLRVELNKKPLLTIGAVSPTVRRMFDIKADVWYLDIDFDTLAKAARKVKITATALPRFPEVRRDLALLIDRGVSFADLRRIAFSAERKLLRSVSLFDVYEGDKLPEGKKSYALAFVLRDDERTLTDQIIDRAMGNIAARLEQEAGARIRQ